MRRRYDIFGNFISPVYFEESGYNCFCILLSNTSSVFVFTKRSLIHLFDEITSKEKMFLFDSEGYETVIFKNHIVKIINVKDDL